VSFQLHQIVILTTHEVDQEGLMAVYRAAADSASKVSQAHGELSAGTAFKLADTVKVPSDPNNVGRPLMTPAHLEAIFGPLAP
jgi:hypothetical protein